MKRCRMKLYTQETGLVFREVKAVRRNEFSDILLDLDGDETVQFTPHRPEVDREIKPEEIREVAKGKPLMSFVRITTEPKIIWGDFRIIQTKSVSEIEQPRQTTVSKDCSEVTDSDGKIYVCQDLRETKFLKYFRTHKTNKDDLFLLDISKILEYAGIRNDSPSRVMPTVGHLILERKNPDESGVFRVRKDVVFE